MFPSADTEAVRVLIVTEGAEAHPEEESHLGKDTCDLSVFSEHVASFYPKQIHGLELHSSL